MRWVSGIFCALVGLVGGYYVTAYAGCTWIWPNSNMCGIVGVPAAFFGMLGGFVAGMKLPGWLR